MSDREDDRMYRNEERRIALEALDANGGDMAKTVEELGWPARPCLANWARVFERTGAVPVSRFESDPVYDSETGTRTVAHYLTHGSSLAETVRELGYPSRPTLLGRWVDELAPGTRWPRWISGPEELAAVAAAQGGITDAERERPRRREATGARDGHGDRLPDDIGEPQDMLKEARARLEETEGRLEEAKGQLRSVQLELDVRRAALEIVKKTPAPS